MSKNKQKPSGWYYIVALVIPIFACLGTTLVVFANVPKLPGALEGMGINDLTQVVVPGSAEIYFPKEGAYAVYYEYRSAINGVGYARGKYPPQLNCQLNSTKTGEGIELAKNYIEGNIYETQNDQRVGVHIMSITIHDPGVYKFSCQYQNGQTSPEIVLAVGPNIIWEFFNIAVKPIAATIIGAFVFVCACGISILIVGVVAYKRYQHKKNLAIQTERMAAKEGE